MKKKKTSDGNITTKRRLLYDAEYQKRKKIIKSGIKKINLIKCYKCGHVQKTKSTNIFTTCSCCLNKTNVKLAMEHYKNNINNSLTVKNQL